ncbi:MAG TPA: hypothetical protein VE462_11925 [Propionibacteriaceae bacterium]|nr:hypothetical protein [Propionibacteriaceae bacterium]
MSEPPGPRNYPSQPDGPMEPGPRQPPSHGGYQPQQPPQTGYEQRPQSETEFQQRPQPQTGYQQQPRQGYQQQPQHGYQQQPQRGYQQQPPYAPRQAYSVHQPSEETTRDAQAALAARMELGPEYSEYVAAGLAERVEQLAALRAGELRHEAEVVNSASRMDQSSRTRQFVLGIVSLAVGVPITAISATNTDPGLIGVAISWLGIVGVNAVHARANRPQQ